MLCDLLCMLRPQVVTEIPFSKYVFSWDWIFNNFLRSNTYGMKNDTKPNWMACWATWFLMLIKFITHFCIKLKIKCCFKPCNYSSTNCESVTLIKLYKKSEADGNFCFVTFFCRQSPDCKCTLSGLQWSVRSLQNGYVGCIEGVSCCTCEIRSNSCETPRKV